MHPDTRLHLNSPLILGDELFSYLNIHAHSLTCAPTVGYMHDDASVMSCGTRRHITDFKPYTLPHMPSWDPLVAPAGCP